MNPLLILQKMKVRDHIPHALLFVGDTLKTKEAALDFAKDLVRDQHCTDLYELFPEGKTGMHTVKSLKSMLQEVMLTPYAGGKKVFIIYESDRMLPSSSNRLLKTLEEPPERTHFLLLTAHKDKMLPTVLSRCYVLHFGQSLSSELTPLQQEFYLCLTKNKPLTSTIHLIEESKKALEKNLTEAEEEKEALLTLHYQEKVRELLVLFYIWARDTYALNLGITGPPLLFPKKCPLTLAQMEKRIEKAELGLERGIALKTLLEYLIL